MKDLPTENSNEMHILIYSHTKYFILHIRTARPRSNIYISTGAGRSDMRSQNLYNIRMESNTDINVVSEQVCDKCLY